LKGSLSNFVKYRRLSNLETLNITNTNFSEGLKYLPKSCKVLYCNSDYPHKSTKITEELEKSNCSVEKVDGKYYNLEK